MKLCSLGIQFKSYSFCKGEEKCSFFKEMADLIYDVIGPGHMVSCRWKRDAKCSDCHLHESFTCSNKEHTTPDNCRVFKPREFNYEYGSTK